MTDHTTKIVTPERMLMHKAAEMIREERNAAWNSKQYWDPEEVALMLDRLVDKVLNIELTPQPERSSWEDEVDRQGD